MYGADDFLPMLTYVVAQCDMPQLDTEIQYMMELLDPSLLQGEGRFLFSLQTEPETVPTILLYARLTTCQTPGGARGGS